MSNNVSHPTHYNQHPAGIECIDIIRHYTCDIANAIKYLWRAGLKPEMGMDDAEKEIEDLKKALFYIEDYVKNINKRATYTVGKAAKDSSLSDKQVCEAQIGCVSGHEISDITCGYEHNVAVAMHYLLQVGLIQPEGKIFMPRTWRHMLRQATEAIWRRILAIEGAITEKEQKKTLQVLNGQAVDGEDYISKPACRRETEPEHYDPLNIIIVFGKAYCLSSEIRKRDNGSLHTPCENCDLMDVCYHDWRHSEESQCRNLCLLHMAETNEYYREVGKAKYAPAFGTIEVVDELKEDELELRRLEEEMEED